MQCDLPASEKAGTRVNVMSVYAAVRALLFNVSSVFFSGSCFFSPACGLSGAVFAPLFKTAAIGILAQLAGTICRDSGQQALAQAVEICCGFVSFYLALPLLELVLSLLQTMIGG